MSKYRLLESVAGSSEHAACPVKHVTTRLFLSLHAGYQGPHDIGCHSQPTQRFRPPANTRSRAAALTEPRMKCTVKLFKPGTPCASMFLE